MYTYEEPWNYVVQRLNERQITLWDGVSIVIRLVDSQREGHFARPFDFERFSMVYMPERLLERLNYAYTSATDARLKNTPRVATVIPPGADRAAFQESIMRTFHNSLGLSKFK
mmetsp:Transcript_12126/g.11976  ORF Transcript_12126/g.11976 Transcript_12126/m.11976 type:complete len:113 (-) Transcript_12126:31-369(-)